MKMHGWLNPTLPAYSLRVAYGVFSDGLSCVQGLGLGREPCWKQGYLT